MGRTQDAFSDEQILELIMLAGFYHTVAYLTNGLKLPLEAYGARLSDYAQVGQGDEGANAELEGDRGQVEARERAVDQCRAQAADAC